MTGRCRVNQANWHLTTAPSGDVLCFVHGDKGNVAVFQTITDSFQIVFEPVANQNGLPIGSFDDVLQSIQLSVMDAKDTLVLCVNGTVACYTDPPHFQHRSHHHPGTPQGRA